MKIQIDFFAVCLSICCYMTTAQALSLSEIELNSFLNQPLDARISLVELKPVDLETLQLRILDSSNLPGAAASMLKIEVKGEGNRHYIHLTSQESIREPVLSFNLEMVWSEGRLIREYSVLMDPKS